MDRPRLEQWLGLWRAQVSAEAGLDDRHRGRPRKFVRKARLRHRHSDPAECRHFGLLRRARAPFAAALWLNRRGSLPATDTEPGTRAGARVLKFELPGD